MIRENKIGKYLKDRLYDFVDLSLNLGIAGVIDYIGGFNIDHPMQDIAFGAGLQAGFAISERKTSRLVSSVIALGLSMYPNFSQLAFSGDAETFLKGAGIKIVGYGAGAVISTFTGRLARRKYESDYFKNSS